ncbi:MAG: family 16 glycosylhydrolase, partial [Reichenbachiella sp.]
MIRHLLLKCNLLLITFLLTASLHAQVGQVIWEDNFNTLDESLWSTTEGDGCPELCGWGNQELEYYHGDNVYIEEIPGEPGNYALVLEAKSESMGDSQFTSGKVTSENKVGIKYGMVEFRIKVPDDLSTGLWPAAWLLGTNAPSEGWPACGEIDIMEMGQNAQFRQDKGLGGANENNVVGGNLLFYSDDACDDTNLDCAASISFDNYYCKPYNGATPLTDRFLIYRMYWDEYQIRFTVEDEGNVQNLYTGPFPIGADAQEFQKPFYFLMNLAVGGNFTDAATAGQVTATIPGKMYIDYVRVRQWNGKGEVFTPEKLMANAGASKTVDEGETVELDASGSYGPISTYDWSIDGVSIGTNSTESVDLAVGSHKITLTITDSEELFATDDITVTVGTDEIGEVLWEDNFDTFDTSIWNTTVGDGCDEGLCGWGNQELEYYHGDNVYIEEMSEEPGNYALVLEAKDQIIGESEFSSGKVTTENKVAIKYGVIEVRMKVPDVQNGLWPAAWLLGTNHRTAGWPQCGEIDMMEMGHSAAARSIEGHSGSPNNFVGANVLWYTSQACAPDNLSCAASIAYDKWYHNPYISSSPMNDRYMTYRLYWDPSSIRLTSFDNGSEHDLYTNSFPLGANEEAFKKPFYFLLNLAIGGSFTGFSDPADVTAPMPAKMYIDYVKVSKWKGQGEVSFGEELLANAGGEIITTDLDKDGVEEITLDGSYSYGSIASYEWSENGGVIATDPTVTIELAAGVHNLQLKVIDAEGNFSTDYMKVDIREILWEENFDTFETSIWNAVEGDGCPELCGWGNQELEYYHADNVYIEEIEGDEGNNALVIEARSETVGDSEFTSGKVTTEGKVSIKYGLIEVRMKVPDDLSTGLWPAAWLLGTNLPDVGWPRSGEIDMMEMGHNNQYRVDEGLDGATENDVVGANLIWYSDDACSGSPDCAASIAFDHYYNKPYQGLTALTDRFLTYRLYWDANEIRLAVEDHGIEFDLYTGPFPLGFTAEEFHKPFYFIMNLAVGGNFTDASTPGQVSATLPAKMLIDYVRVMKWNGQGEVAFGNGMVADAGADVIILDANGDGSESVILDASKSAHHSGDIESYSWAIDESEIATGAIPTVDLNRGTYDVVLTVTDTEGITATDIVSVTVTAGGLAPLADAGIDRSIDDDDGDDLVTVVLDASATEEANAPIVSYTWYEDEVEIATGVSPSVEFSTGIHVLTLDVLDEDELIGSAQVIITVVDPDNAVPTADAGTTINESDDNGDDLVSITLDGAGSTDSDGTIENYSWLIDDIEVAVGVSPAIELSTGIYLIDLIVTDDDGVEGQSQVSVTITDPDNIAPTAMAGDDIMLIDTDLSGSESYSLDALSSTDSDGTIEAYLWSEDASELANSAESTIDLSVGHHTITLEVTDDDGISATDEVTVVVNQLPTVDAGNDIQAIDTDDNGTETLALDASASSDPNGSIVSYVWIVNESEITTGETSSFDFAIGTHAVTLEVTDDDGSVVTDEMMIIVSRADNNAPVAEAGADVTRDDDDNSGSETYTFDATGSSDTDGFILSYVWFEDGVEIATGESPSVSLGIGKHNIVLEVTDNEGASTSDEVVFTTTQSVCIFEACTGDFTSEVLSGDSGTSIKFVPSKEGIGDATCLLYYGTTAPFGGHLVSPNEAYVLSGVSVGQTISYYYTYSTNGPDQTTNACQNSFEVGNCGEEVDAAASLSNLSVNGTTVAGFDANTLDYTVSMASGTTSTPTVTAIATDASSTIAVNPASSLPGVTTIIVTSSDESVSVTYSIMFTIPVSGMNLALNKTVVTSSDENGETSGSNAVDGNESTRWASIFADPQWMYVDLGTSYSLGNVIITWEAAYASAYEIQISDDASNWTTVHTESAGSGGTEEVFVSGDGRYVRMNGTSRATPYGYSIYELEVYAAAVTFEYDVTFNVVDSDDASLSNANVSFQGENVTTNSSGIA